MEAFRLREELAETQIARIALAMVASDAGDRAAATDLLAAVQRVSSATQLDVWGLTALAVRARNAVLHDGRSEAADALELLAQVSLTRLWEDRESRFEALQDRMRQREMAEQHERLGRASLVDPMTGLGNRRRLQQVLERPDQRFSAVLLDVDRFRAVNDEHGHEAGDAVLRRIADLVQRNVGDDDIVVRYGADEFVVLVPGGRGAEQTAERLLEVVRKEPWLEISLGLRVTVSAGVAGPASAAEALAAADRAVLDAKRSGRDRLVTG